MHSMIKNSSNAKICWELLWYILGISIGIVSGKDEDGENKMKEDHL